MENGENRKAFTREGEKQREAGMERDDGREGERGEDDVIKQREHSEQVLCELTVLCVCVCW